MLKSCIVLLLCFFNVYANRNIEEKINNILNKVPLSTVSAVQITKATTNEIIYERNSTKIVIPASNTKLFTTAVALTTMGTAYEFTTKLFTDDDNIKDGIINGNLYIKGFGNSTFTEKDLDDYVTELKQLGVKKITGKVIGDDSYLDDLYTRDDWITNETANVPLPAISALVLNRNMMTIDILAGSKSGRLVDVNVRPFNNFVKIINNAKVTTGKRRPSVRLKFDGEKYVLTVTGNLRRNNSAEYNVKIDNPPFFMASVLQSKLVKEGIEISGEPTTGVISEKVNFIASTPLLLVDLISKINKRSDNFLAECLFKSLGAFKSQKQGNSFYAAQAVNEFINEHDVYSEGVSVVDGSGISRFNEVTVKTLSDLLLEMFNKPEYFEIYKNSLSIAGVEGTLRQRLNFNLNNKFWGKTGTLNGVSSVTGYLETKKMEYYVISIVFQFKQKSIDYYKNIQDEIIELIESEY